MLERRMGDTSDIEDRGELRARPDRSASLRSIQWELNRGEATTQDGGQTIPYISDRGMMTSRETGSIGDALGSIFADRDGFGGTFDPERRGVTPMTMPTSRIPSWGRRRVLKAGALPFLGLDLPRLLAAEATPRGPGRPRREKSCIFIFQYGGLSQLDSWDPKPDAPAEIRGPYRPIATAVPGFHVGELMPRLARLADRYCVIRSMTHTVPVHDVANRMLLAGQSLPAMTAPSFGSMVAKLRPSEDERAVARLAPEVRRRGDAPGSDLPDRRAPGDGPRPDARRRRARRQPGDPGFRVGAFDMPDGLSLDRARGRMRLLGEVEPAGTRSPPPAAGPVPRACRRPARRVGGPARLRHRPRRPQAPATATAATRSGRTCSWPAG